MMVFIWLQNITKVFEMMSSNTTEYDTNWRFQMDYSESLFAVKMLTEEGDLAVTYHDEDTILTNKISGVSQGDEDPKYQVFAICNDCP